MADDIEIEVDMTELTDGLKKLDKAQEHALIQAAKSIGMTAVGFAQEKCPVDTGLLRNSLTYALAGEPPAISYYEADRPKTDNGKKESGTYSGAMPKEKELAVYIGSNVKYAERQENGDFQHHTGQSKHFLKMAATDHNEDYKNLIESAMSAANP